MFTLNWQVESPESWYQWLMLRAVQFTCSTSHLYSRMHLQKLEILSVYQVKRSVDMQQHLVVYTSVASKNAGVKRVKTPVKTPLIGRRTTSVSTTYLSRHVPHHLWWFFGWSEPIGHWGKWVPTWTFMVSQVRIPQCAVHTTRTEATTFVLNITSPQVCIRLKYCLLCNCSAWILPTLRYAELNTPWNVPRFLGTHSGFQYFALVFFSCNWCKIFFISQGFLDYQPEAES